MDYLYLSSGLFGAKVLSFLKPKPSLVITQADKFGGRGMKTLIKTPVKKYCQEKRLPLVEVKNKAELENRITYDVSRMTYGKNIRHTQHDIRHTLFLTCDFGLIIPSFFFSPLPHRSPLTAHRFFLNLHPSLLPKYRGPSPIQTALLNGEAETGVSLMQMDEQIDHGPIIAQEKCLIDINDNNLSLMDKLAKLGAETMNKYQKESIAYGVSRMKYKMQEQNHQTATYTKKFTKQDGYVKFSEFAYYLNPIFRKYNLPYILNTQYLIRPEILHRKISGLLPFPLVWTTLPNGKILKILQSEYNKKNNELIIKEIQIEGKKYFL